MTDYYPQLTQATTDSEVIHLWLSRKRQATKTSYATVVRQFYSFIGDKGLAEVVLDDILMWVESRFMEAI